MCWYLVFLQSNISRQHYISQHCDARFMSFTWSTKEEKLHQSLKQHFIALLKGLRPWLQNSCKKTENFLMPEAPRSFITHMYKWLFALKLKSFSETMIYGWVLSRLNNYNFFDTVFSWDITVLKPECFSLLSGFAPLSSYNTSTHINNCLTLVPPG